MMIKSLGCASEARQLEPLAFEFEEQPLFLLDSRP